MYPDALGYIKGLEIHHARSLPHEARTQSHDEWAGNK